MLATAKKDQSKTSTAKAGHAEPASEREISQGQNKRWQSLALSTVGIQAKLAISRPDDPYEQEADRVADRVLRAPGPRLQRACACGGQCPTCMTVPSSDDHVHVQTMHVPGGGSSQKVGGHSGVHEALNSPGRPLDPSTRAFMESRFGDDFSNVRVRTDARATQSARALNALAYTVGSDLVFGTGQYAPHTDTGKRLLAHELTHVLQQRGNGGSGFVFRQTEPAAQPPNQDERSDSGDASASLQAVIAEIEQGLSRATQYLSSKEPTPEELQLTAAMTGQLQRLRQVADGDNDALKLKALESFSSERRSQADEQLAAARQSTGASSTSTNGQVQRQACENSSPIEGMLFRQPAPVIPPAAPPPPPPPLTLVPPPVAAPPPVVAAPGGALLEILGAIGGAVAVIITFGIFIPSDTAVKPPSPQPQPQPKPKKDPQRDCMQTHPSALPCTTGVSMEEVATLRLMDEGYEHDDLGDCRKMSSFGPGKIDDCGGAPGESWHCRINGTADELSIFGCLCCNTDGSTGFEWTGAHISPARPR